MLIEIDWNSIEVQYIHLYAYFRSFLNARCTFLGLASILIEIDIYGDILIASREMQMWKKYEKNVFLICQTAA